MTWTDQQKARVRELWADGWSAAQIAKEVGAVSRCAIIGVIHRNNWQRGAFLRVWTSERLAELKKLDLAGYQVSHAAKKMDLSERQIHDGLAHIRRQVSERRIRIHQRPRTPRVVPLIPKDAAAPVANQAPTSARPILFLNLAPGQCKWPLGNYDDPPEFFCGGAAVVGVSYCPYHQSVSCYGSGAELPEPERSKRRVGSIVFTKRVA